eukprot:4800118-Pleurochrysis_carterae.AAC.2
MADTPRAECKRDLLCARPSVLADARVLHLQHCDGSIGCGHTLLLCVVEAARELPPIRRERDDRQRYGARAVPRAAHVGLDLHEQHRYCGDDDSSRKFAHRTMALPFFPELHGTRRRGGEERREQVGEDRTVAHEVGPAGEDLARAWRQLLYLLLSNAASPVLLPEEGMDGLQHLHRHRRRSDAENPGILPRRR